MDQNWLFRPLVHYDRGAVTGMAHLGFSGWAMVLLNTVFSIVPVN
jgi:hypothetical protein